MELDQSSFAVIVVVIGCLVFCAVGFFLGRLSVTQDEVSSASRDLTVANQKMEVAKQDLEVEISKIRRAIANEKPEDALAEILNERRDPGG
jgi:K+-transporting ATPase c subunit